MKLYADRPGRRTGQLLADLAVVAWVALWVYVGRFVHGEVLRLAAPGERLQDAGSGFAGRMSAAGDRVDNLPLIDDRLAQPLREVSGVGTEIEDAGRDLVAAVERLAMIVGWLTALVPILLVVTVWLWLRLRFAIRASAAQRFIDDASDLDLFALRAIARQPVRALARVSHDPVGDWRAGDRRTIHALALLELREVGLRPPANLSPAPRP